MCAAAAEAVDDEETYVFEDGIVSELLLLLMMLLFEATADDETEIEFIEEADEEARFAEIIEEPVLLAILCLRVLFF
jgi:hypothetical protein